MSITRKVHAHGELFWWLILSLMAVALTCVLAREAHGTRVGGSVPVAIVAWTSETAVE